MDLELGASRPANTKPKDGALRKDIVLAYNTLGVVFGGVVTSPLYVYSAMNLRSPSEEDYLGIFSTMFWTLTLIGVVKYVGIALNADDNGEGGTLALYSLLCRHANIGVLRRSGNADAPATGKQSRLGGFIERSVAARRVLLFLAMLGMCMLIGDGILTPAISVLSAIGGLRGPFPSLSKSVVEALSSVILVILFLLQRFGTSRVSFLFSPIMASWTFSTPAIGIYSFLRYYPGVFKAVSPYYVVQFFLRNRERGWQLLGGIVLCITGAEAMFADLGHFSKRSIQIAFVFIVYPSLVLTYAGQTAYLIRNVDDHDDGFFKFVPGPVYWPVFAVTTLASIVASQSLISAAFSVVKQAVLLDYFPRVKVVHTSRHKEGEVYSPEANCILMVLCVGVVLGFGDGREIGNAFGVVVIFVMLITTILLTLVMVLIWKTPPALAGLYFAVFFVLEGAYATAVMTKFLEGGWLPFAISVILAFVMFGWYYGRQRKTEYETAHKITVECLAGFLSSPDVQRVPGLCFFYSNTQEGFPPVLGHYIHTMRSFHSVTVFLTLQYLPIDRVAADERFIWKRFGIRGVYGCTVQYGYTESIRRPEGAEFVTRVVKALQEHMVASSDEHRHVGITVDEEISLLQEARSVGVVHFHGKARFHVEKAASWFDKVMLGFYEFLHRNCRSALPGLGLPLQDRLEIGMFYKA